MINHEEIIKKLESEGKLKRFNLTSAAYAQEYLELGFTVTHVNWIKKIDYYRTLRMVLDSEENYIESKVCEKGVVSVTEWGSLPCEELPTGWVVLGKEVEELNKDLPKYVELMSEVEKFTLSLSKYTVSYGVALDALMKGHKITKLTWVVSQGMKQYLLLSKNDVQRHIEHRRMLPNKNTIDTVWTDATGELSLDTDWVILDKLDGDYDRPIKGGN